VDEGVRCGGPGLAPMGRASPPLLEEGVTGVFREPSIVPKIISTFKAYELGYLRLLQDNRDVPFLTCDATPAASISSGVGNGVALSPLDALSVRLVILSEAHLTFDKDINEERTDSIEDAERRAQINVSKLMARCQGVAPLLHISHHWDW
jgi:hypothetical protein